MTRYNLFGSEDSLDYDVMFQVDRIPKNKQECKILCTELENSYLYQDKKVNANICVVNNEEIVEVFKGTPDECNNAVFKTYYCHTQRFPCLVSRLVPRDVALKVDRSLRIILSFLSRTEYRPIVKDALRSPVAFRRENCINCLYSIDFNSIKSFGTKNGEPKDIVKQIAFQMAQVVGLLANHTEIYSKYKACNKFPPLIPYLHRQESDLETLNRFKSLYLYEISLWRKFALSDPNEWRDDA